VSLSLAEIRHVVDEAAPDLVGGRLDSAAQSGPAAVVLTFYARRSKRHLLVSADPRFSRLHLAAERPAPAPAVTPFVRSLRQALRGRTLTTLAAVGDDRIVELAFGPPDAPAGRLVAELTGRTSNVYLLGPEGRVLATLRSVRKSARDLRPGAPYEPPSPAPASRAAGADRFADHPGPISQAIERLYAAAEADEAIRSLRAALTASLRAARKRTARLLDKLRADLASAQEADHLRLCGELLKAHLGQIPARQSRVALPNLFEPGAPDLDIPLQTNLSPQENMERYFRRYKRLLAARREAETRAADAQRRLDALDRRALAVQAATTLDELQALADDTPARPQASRPRAPGPRAYLSADGLEILVGRSNAENDQLTFHLARGNDLWLHVEGYTGSHVVVRVPKGKSVPKETLLDAATLAVHHSQCRRSGGGPVAYTTCKHVTRPRGGGPGQALYTQSKTLHIDLDPARLTRLTQSPRDA